MKIINLLVIMMTIAIYGMAQTNFKVVTYNTLRFPDNNDTTPGGTTADRLAAFQDIMEDINPDVIIFQELVTVGGANDLLNTLNASNLSKTFARTPQAPANNSGTGGNMLFYNTALFSFINENTIPRINTVIAPDGVTVVKSTRSANIYRLNASSPANPGTIVPIYFISAHLQSSNGSNSSDPKKIPDEERRGLGAKDIMDYIQTSLGSTDNVILVGDMNFYDETEIGYEDFTISADYTELLNDPLGAWQRDNQSSVSKFTQSPRVVNNAVGNGGAGGGLCDRFDFIFYNDDIATGNNGVGYVSGTMQAYGTMGVHVNQSALSGTHPLKQQLYNFTDHYPVIAEFTLDPSVVTNTDCTPYKIDGTNTIIEDFSTFAGQGFTNDPAPGQLCSKSWNFDGFSDTYIYGDVNIGNDYARGGTNGGSSQGGIYDNNRKLWIQPTGSDFTGGSMTMKICNDTGNTIDSMRVSFDMYILNDTDRSNSFDFYYSPDSLSFTYLPAMSEISLGTSTSAMSFFPKSIALYNVNIAHQDCFFLKWVGNDVSGNGARDEFGIDNIGVEVLQAPPCPALLIINNAPITNGIYEANNITSSGTIPIGGTVEFKGADCILLDNGFTVEGDLNVTVDGCNQ